MTNDNNYSPKQCPNCGAVNSEIEKTEYFHPPPIFTLRGNELNMSPKDARLQIRIYQALGILGIIGFTYGLISGTWGRNGETASIRGGTLEIVIVFFIIPFIFYSLHLLNKQEQKIDDIKTLTYYICLDCSHSWRFPRHLLSLDSSKTNTEIERSKEFYQMQVDLRTYQEIKRDSRSNLLVRWLLGLLAILSALFLWKRGKR